MKVLTLCGGVPLRPHLASLAHEPHIVVGTPGRILELIEKQALPLQAIKVLVLDEADRMLDMGFADAIDAIVQATPEQRQNAAVLGDHPEVGSRDQPGVQREAVDVTVASDSDEVLIEQTFFEVAAESKLHALESLLLRYRPESAVVFCNTLDKKCVAVAEDLFKCGFSVLALHGDLDQREREEMLVRFANRSCTVLVASTSQLVAWTS